MSAQGAPMSALLAARPTPAADYELTAADFERVRGLIMQRAGISLHSGKQAMVQGRLSRRVRKTEHASIGDYLRWLETLRGATGEDEWQEFVNCLTTNLTAFFREEHHFPLLADAMRAHRGAAMRIWCNAASTGEEPYSLAMTAIDALGARPAVGITASDIDTNVLETARRGVYAVDARGLSPELLRRHFLRGTGANNGFIRARPELGALIDFRPFNLMDERWSLGEPFDIVFCRNVMIYFDAATQLRVLEGMHRVMRTGALLFAGHSENFSQARSLFKLRGKTVYERI
jgi:chemotaxis protein methyltransferase CheR